MIDLLAEMKSIIVGFLNNDNGANKISIKEQTLALRQISNLK